MLDEAPQDPLVGSVLEGRFQIERLLGEGGMGRVYVADELRLRRRCAVKVLLPELMEDQGCVERFLREAQAIAQIHHENVVEIYHLGENVDSGVVFFAMEMLVGKDLETRLLERASKPVSWQQITRWMEQVASAMAAVHATGMIHRDLKPSNVFLASRRGRDQVKLLDFGIAKTATHTALTGTGAALGTPYYMSPEQILAQPLDSRSDIYSFGVLFFEALAGRMPFVGEPLQVAMQHCNLPMPTLAAVAPGIDTPPELEALIQRMLAKDRDDRVQTMEEIESFLHELLLAHNGSAAHRSLAGLTASGSGPITSSGDATTRQRTLLAGSTPAARSAPATVKLTTAESPTAKFITAESPTTHSPSTKPRSRLLVALLAGVTLLGCVVVLMVLVLSGGEVPAPATDPLGTLARVEPTPAPVVVPPASVPVPVMPVWPVMPPPEPVPPALTTTGAAAPVPPETAPDQPRVRKPVSPRGADKPGDPLTQIRRAADACRRTHKAGKGPLITIDYATASDGTVTRAVPTTKDALGKCLADAVKAARFAPELKLGRKIDL